MKSLNYLGYSEGTTLAFALLAHCPDYNKKINLFAAYAPITFVTFATSAIALVSRLQFAIEIGVVEIFPHSLASELFAKYVCGSPFFHVACDVIYYRLNGFDPVQLNHTRMPLYFNRYFAGESTKTVIHYSQLIYAPDFQIFDYNSDYLVHYNQI